MPLALSVGAAHAAISPPTSGSGELIEWVVDNTTGHVYARGIQVDETSVLPAASILSQTDYGNAASLPVSTKTSPIPAAGIGPDANLTTFLGQNGGHDSFSFGLLGAGQNTGGATANAPGASVVVFTSNQSLADSNLNVPSASGLQSNVGAVLATVNTLNSQLPDAAGSSADVSGTYNLSSHEFNLYNDTIAILTALGSNIDLYAATGNSSKAGTGQLYTAGQITMTANGTLEAVSSVPLPAAVWLLGSGLLGLAGVGRRRAV